MLYRMTSHTIQTLHSVWFASETYGSATGDSGTICLTPYGVKDWVSIREPFVGNFYTQFFNDSITGAYAGDSGVIYTELGNRQVIIKLPESNAIYGMTFPSYDTGAVCGAAGSFYMTTDSGKIWNKITLPTEAQKIDFHGTDYFDDDTYWLVGQKGTVLYTENDGKNWEHILVPTSSDLYSINFPDSTGAGWIVGDQVLLYTLDDGNTWQREGRYDSLRFVAGWDSTDAYAVGMHGEITHTTDGITWNSIPSGTSANLYGLDFPDSLFFVGDSGLILTTLPVGSPSLVSNTALGAMQSITLETRNRSIALTYPSEWTEPLRIELYNELGTLVVSQDVQGQPNVQLGELHSGPYFYRLSNGNSSETGKFFLSN